jgi:hypothetical protein
VQTWKLSADPQFIEKVRGVVGLYLDPPDKPWSSRSMRKPDPVGCQNCAGSVSCIDVPPFSRRT